MSGLHNHRNGQYGHAHAVSQIRVLLQRAQPGDASRNRECRIPNGSDQQVPRRPEEVYRFETYLKGSDGRNAVKMADAAREFITNKDDDHPFFLSTSEQAIRIAARRQDENSPSKLKPDLFGNKPDRGSHRCERGVLRSGERQFRRSQPTRRNESWLSTPVVRYIDQGVAL